MAAAADGGICWLGGGGRFPRKSRASVAVRAVHHELGSRIESGASIEHSACVIAREIAEKIFIVEVWRGREDFESLSMVACRLIEKPRFIGARAKPAARSCQAVQFALNGRHPAVRLGCYLPIVFS
jgi:hypothetical protein